MREIPVIKYAKRLGNQVLSSLGCLEAGCNWFGKDMKLVCPNDDTGTEEERRPYLEVVRTNVELCSEYFDLCLYHFLILFIISEILKEL